MPIVGNSYYNDPNIGAGFQSLAAAFAPPSTSELATAATIQQAQAKAAANASSLARIAAGQATPADYLQVDPTGGTKQYATAEAVARAKSGRPIAELDPLIYARDGKFSDTAAAFMSPKLSQGEIQTRTPALARMFGMPQTVYGGQNVAEGNTLTLPGQGGAILPPAAAADAEDGAPMPLTGAGMQMPPGSTGNITLQGQTKDKDKAMSSDQLTALIMNGPDALNPDGTRKWTPEQVQWAKSTHLHAGTEDPLKAARDKGFGEGQSEPLKAVGTKAGIAPAAIENIHQMRSAINAGGDNLSYGPGSNEILKLKQFGSNLLGRDLSGVAEGQVINNIGTGIATQAARAISNRPTQMEWGKILEVKPGLAGSKTGALALLDIMEQEHQAALELNKIAQNDKARENWPQTEADYYRAHPIMSPFDKSQALGARDIQHMTDAAVRAGIDPNKAPGSGSAPAVTGAPGTPAPTFKILGVR